MWKCWSKRLMFSSICKVEIPIIFDRLQLWTLQLDKAAGDLEWKCKTILRKMIFFFLFFLPFPLPFCTHLSFLLAYMTNIRKIQWGFTGVCQYLWPSNILAFLLLLFEISDGFWCTKATFLRLRCFASRANTSCQLFGRTGILSAPQLKAAMYFQHVLVCLKELTAA